ncbi:hypothetical protein [Nocardia cyriacigeorgica]|uniref:hypothetical protein n=1 Tax=Nocardia cyriacigeorgica TaxID=135487 RepID=UPI001892E13F|nr:hypothetical protein [Nocardia cyriacigeorgica]MBF6456178.1 hypothetical protein [Nocardia cyriacigeorgica]MBF6478602.1 hypothetical protein [Nocardia cyriacigeorgica]MBF6553082.1 hypothetical protein [Nocardia cyriacigeorgica]
MAGPNPWQAKAARDTGESASRHSSDQQNSPESGGLFGAGSAGGVAVSGEFVGGGAVESGAARSGAAGAPKYAGAGAGEGAAARSADAGQGDEPEHTRAESVAVNSPEGVAGSGGAAVAGGAATEGAGESRRRRADAVRARAAAVRGASTPLRGHWGYLVAAVGAFITLVLMTRPWLVATGANGSVESTAFGRIDVSTKYLTVWSKSAPKTPQISGLWAFATAAVIVLTICLVVLYFRMRSEYFARLVALSSVGVAVLVLFTMLYLDSKGAELKALTARKYDLGGQVGQFLSWVKGNGKFILPGAGQGQYVATSRFTPSAVAAAAVAVVSALAAVTQWMVGRGIEPGSLMAKVSALREKWDAAGRAAAASSVAAAPATARAVSVDKPASAEPAGAPADSAGPSPTGERAADAGR